MKLWRRETSHFIVGGVLVLLLATAGWFIYSNFQSKVSIRIESAVFQVGLADRDASREKNLSHQTDLDLNGGMLLAYGSDDRWEVPVKSLGVAVDILWLDQEKKVVQIVRDVAPNSSSDVVYTPKQPARYIVEIPAGKAKESGIKVGSQAGFTIEEGKVE